MTDMAMLRGLIDGWDGGKEVGGVGSGTDGGENDIWSWCWLAL